MENLTNQLSTTRRKVTFNEYVMTKDILTQEVTWESTTTVEEQERLDDERWEKRQRKKERKFLRYFQHKAENPIMQKRFEINLKHLNTVIVEEEEEEEEEEVEEEVDLGRLMKKLL